MTFTNFIRKGFDIRYRKSRLNVERTKCMQEIVCGCAGKAGVENTRSCRCDCECFALIRLLRSKDNGWHIAGHLEQHNHSLPPTYSHTIHWPSHKHIDVYSRDLVEQLRQNNVNLAKVYSIIPNVFGSTDKGSSLHISCSGWEAEENYKDKKTRMGRPLLRTNLAIERHAGKIYTRAMFKQSVVHTKLRKLRRANCMLQYTQADRREKWCRLSYKAHMLYGGEEFDRECGQFAHMRLPCNYVLKVLDFIRIKEIPRKHVVKRWTREIFFHHSPLYQKGNAH